MTLQVVVFSKDRPLQLHGYLSSLFTRCIDPDRLQVKVLFRADARYGGGYAAIANEVPDTEWLPQADFCWDVDHLIGDADLTMFGCDDALFAAPWAVKDVERAFETIDWLLGISLRLGRNVTADMFQAPLLQPVMHWEHPWWLTWDVTQGVGDWGYPWEVLGTVYPTDYVKRMVARILPSSPSQLEEVGSRIWAEETDKRTMACWQTSRLVVPTVNLVQSEFPNGIVGQKPLSPEFLLDCWTAGLRMDTERYASMEPQSWRIGDFYLRRAA